MSIYFGEPWPSGICDGGRRVPTPDGKSCVYCSEPIKSYHQGSFVGVVVDVDEPGELEPIHKECSLRSVLGGIGHLENHPYWCNLMHDPDGGRSARQSALEAWDWIQVNGMPVA